MYWLKILGWRELKIFWVQWLLWVVLKEICIVTRDLGHICNYKYLVLCDNGIILWTSHCVSVVPWWNTENCNHLCCTWCKSHFCNCNWQMWQCFKYLWKCSLIYFMEIKLSFYKNYLAQKSEIEKLHHFSEWNLMLFLRNIECIKISLVNKTSAPWVFAGFW